MEEDGDGASAGTLLETFPLAPEGVHGACDEPSPGAATAPEPHEDPTAVALAAAVPGQQEPSVPLEEVPVR